MKKICNIRILYLCIQVTSRLTGVLSYKAKFHWDQFLVTSS